MIRKFIHPALFSFFAFSMLAFSGCQKEDEYEKQLQIDIGKIEQYIDDNNLPANSTGTGLYYVVHHPGTGKKPNSSSTVTVRYKGTLLNGYEFDKAWSPPATFNLSSVIEGWQQGIPLFKEGGRGILLIPSGLGYGTQSVGDIPANSVLIFEIELVAVN